MRGKRRIGPPPPRKKNRGARRRARELERWAREETAALEPGRLADLEYASAEIWFCSWRWPAGLRMRREMVRHLVEIHDRWRERLETLDQPWYLGIWLLEPFFMESQVVAAVGWRAEEYARRHDEPGEVGVAPPPDYHGHPLDLSRFVWTRHRFADREAADDGSETVVERESWYGRLATQDTASRP